MNVCWVFLGVTCVCTHLVSSANILAFMAGSSTSHKLAYWPLLTALAQRGHRVTFLNPFKAWEKVDNLEEIQPSGLAEMVQADVDLDMFADRVNATGTFGMDYMDEYLTSACTSILSSPETKALFDGRKYDLMIVDPMTPECGLGFVYYFKVPFIYFSTAGLYSYLHPGTGTPGPHGWGTDYMFPVIHADTMWNRVQDLTNQMLLRSIRKMKVHPKLQVELRKHVGDGLPPLEDVEKNVGLVLLNTHPAIDAPMPYFPNIIEVGGIHLREPRPLPKDLLDFVEGSGEAGVILFSWGSVVHSNHMPESYRQMFLRVFGRLKQRVLWKWEDDSLVGVPSNVRVSKWLPQQDLLAHPNKVRAFITHGGLLSVTEAVYHAVPVVVTPFYGDQDRNAHLADTLGYGVQLELGDVTEELLYNTLVDITQNPKYKKAVEERSAILRDRPMKPADLAVYWTEYVLRHKNLSHLRFRLRDLPWYQHYFIDVAVCLLGTLTVISYILKKVCRCNASKKTPKKKVN